MHQRKVEDSDASTSPDEPVLKKPTHSNLSLILARCRTLVALPAYLSGDRAGDSCARIPGRISAINVGKEKLNQRSKN